MNVDMTNKPQLVEHVHKSLQLTVYETKWVPCSARFCVLGSPARQTGMIQLYNLVRGDVELIAELERPKSFKCGTFGHSALADRHFATGDFAGEMAIWDLERLKTPTFQVQAHETIINCIDGCGGLKGAGAPEIVTGGRDGCVHVWDPRQPDGPVASMEPEEGAPARDCWAVSFGDAHSADDRVVCAGYDNGDVKLLDLTAGKVRWETNVSNGVCGVEFDRKDIAMNKLVVSTLESRFRLYDMRTHHPVHGYSFLSQAAHESTVWAARHLPQNRDVFVTCGGNGSLVSTPSPRHHRHRHCHRPPPPPAAATCTSLATALGVYLGRSDPRQRRVACRLRHLQELWKYSYPNQRSIKEKDGHSKGVLGQVQLLQKKTFSTQVRTRNAQRATRNAQRATRNACSLHAAPARVRMLATAARLLHLCDSSPSRRDWPCSARAVGSLSLPSTGMQTRRASP